MSETAVFAREFLRSPLRTASLISSSSRLVERLVAAVPERGEPVVVELGPGNTNWQAADATLRSN
ncbi:hypothetical protein [Streptomyces sp. NPDC002559]